MTKPLWYFIGLILVLGLFYPEPDMLSGAELNRAEYRCEQHGGKKLVWQKLQPHGFVAVVECHDGYSEEWNLR